eukprot:CAMPEP_0114558430 /NCGR_PEP_ID=MMETSP0114-20121206/10379_1 /TAXON_ID=31324 /ORGANISM="Goniomonas sp, Strain m" /LENGTH=290 /DNA_ID=CAMNT_0001743823 /DNA_START=22 /DNA_END=894 /DNA_ORIENTATION=+
MEGATGNLAAHQHVGGDIAKYIESFHVSTLFRNLLQDLVREKPENPLQFLKDRVDNFVTYKIIIVGAPAAGKGTQCDLLMSKYGMTHISTGDLLRDEVQTGTKLGLDAKGFMDAGKLVPDHVVVEMVSNRITQPDCRHNGWVLDGFPRTLEQAHALRALGVEPDICIFLNVPDEEIEERVVGRWSDPITGKIYHLKFNPPPPEIRSRLVQRIDDNTEKVKAMLDTFHANTEPILQFYSSFVEVDGTQGKVKVFSDICAILDQLAKPTGSTMGESFYSADTGAPAAEPEAA